MKLGEMNSQERKIWCSLPEEIRKHTQVTNDYQHRLGIVQKHLKTLYGERADWKKCLDRYYTDAQYNDECHKIDDLRTVPELSADDIKAMIQQEEHDTELIDELKSLIQLVSHVGNKVPSTPEIYRAAEILGILPNSANGLNKWMVNFDDLSKEEIEAFNLKTRNSSGLMSIAIGALADYYVDGFVVSYPSEGTVLTQGKRRYYYRGENAYYASSKASIARSIDEKLPEHISQMLLDLRFNEGCLFLDNFDAVIRWPVTDSVNYPALAQHYGLRTPVMDVTSDLKTALFFACCTYDNDKWRPLKEEEFRAIDSRQNIHSLGGDSRYAILYRTPTDITDMEWGTQENPGMGIIVPIGYQPFMRCSAQHGYVFFTSRIDYDMMRDPLFAKYKIRLSTELCEWIYNEMQQGSLVYPEKDIPDLNNYFAEINRTKHFSQSSFELVMEDFKIESKYAEVVKQELAKYGIFIINGNKQYITYNRLQKINKRYSVERSLEINNVKPISRPMLVMS